LDREADEARHAPSLTQSRVGEQGRYAGIVGHSGLMGEGSVASNEKLKAARLSRPSSVHVGASMSRAELADAVNAHLWDATGRRYVLDAHAIARYERGFVCWPSAAYRSALRVVLGAASDSDLGFRPTPRGRTGDNRSTDPEELTLNGTGEPDQMPLDRGELLRTGLVGLATMAIGSEARSSPGDYRRQLANLQRQDRLQGSEQPLAGVLRAVNAVKVDLRNNCGSDRTAMLRVASRIAEFAGFLYRDLGDLARCLYWHDRAMEWAQQSDDVAMQSYILLRKAQAAFDRRDATRMLDLTLAAGRWTDPLGPGLRAEIHQQRARGEAMLGARDRDVRERLDMARTELASSTEPRAEDEPGCHYNDQLLALQTAICMSEAGRPAEAVVLYEEILAADTTSRRDRAYFSILMATSLAMSGEPDEAARVGCTALPTAVATGSRRSLGEANVLIGVLWPWRQRAQVRVLVDLLRSVATASTP
jgi:hypothetical protein